jgi:predicted TIM-barrel fold metal-dependent hydrolase
LPGASIIVGHTGGPLGYGPYAGKRDEVFAAWQAGITELATCPNVVMKLGGMMIRLAAHD